MPGKGLSRNIPVRVNSPRPLVATFTESVNSGNAKDQQESSGTLQPARVSPLARTTTGTLTPADEYPRTFTSLNLNVGSCGFGSLATVVTITEALSSDALNDIPVSPSLWSGSLWTFFVTFQDPS